jgi:hypothetical protein
VVASTLGQNFATNKWFLSLLTVDIYQIQLNYLLKVKFSPVISVETQLLSILTPTLSGFGGLELECWPLVPKFAGSQPTW